MQKFDIEVGASFSSRKRTSRSCICLVILSVAVFLFATVSAIFVTLYVMEKNPSAPSTEKASLSYAPSTERKTVTPPSTTTHKEEQKHNGSKTCPPTSLDIDDCTSHPCKNNGTCTDRVNGFNCSCSTGFSGTQCETDIDDCANHPCKNNGTCTDRVNGFNCSCAPGFNGTQCETDIDDCTSHPCKNNGTCTDQVNGFNCSCAPGFNGTQCETDIDDCARHPCKNNGTCTDQVNGFNCSCAPGFNGTQCETVDICKSYQNLTDAERKYDYVTVNYKCDDTLNGWYRFQGAAGTKMVTTCPPKNRCDADFPAWFSGDHPTVAEGTVKRKVCIHKFGACCDTFLLIQVKNCSSYYIYKLRDPGLCDTRYCSTD